MMLSKRKITRKTVTYIGIIIAVTLSIFPIFYLVLTSFKPPQMTFSIPPVWFFKPTLQNYREVSGDFVKYLFNSLTVGVSAVLISMVLGIFAAFGFARFKFRSNFMMRMAALIPQMLPPIIIVVPIFVLFTSLKLMDTKLALVISYLTFTMPLSMWMMIGFFEEVPIELEEAAMIDGCSRLRAMLTIELPIAVPGLAATAVISFIYCWNEFLYAVILTGRDARTLPVMITSFMTTKAILWGRIAAAGSLVLLPVLVFALIFQRYLIRGLAFGSVKG